MTQPIDEAFVEIKPDLSAFDRELDQGISDALREMSREIISALQRVEQAVADTGQEIGARIERGTEVAERAFDELRRAAENDLERISRQAGNTATAVGGRMRGMLAFIGPALLGVATAGAAGVAALTGFGLQSAASLEQTQIAFNSLLGSAEAGQAIFKDLQQFAAVTPFEFPELVGAAQRFFAFNDAIGMTDGQVRDFLTTLGNIASVSGGGAAAMDRVTLALGQIASRGKLSLEEINQISEALPGFSGVAAIASATGQSLGETMDAISAGEIDATTGIAALLKGMQTFPGAAGAMEKQAQTLLGVFSTFKDTLSQALVAGFAPVIPDIKAALGEITPVLGGALGKLAPVLGKALAAILPLVASLVEGIVPVLIPIVDALGPALEALGPSLAPLGQSLGEILIALAPILPLLGEFLNAVIQLAIPFLRLLAIVLTPLTPLIEFLAEAVGEFGEALTRIDWGAVGAAIGGFFADVWADIVDFFEGVGEFFADLPGDAREWFGKMHAAIVAKIREMLAFVQNIPARIVAGLGNLGNLLLEKGKDLIRGFWNGISSLGGWLYNRVKQFVWDNTIGALNRALGIGSPSKVMAEQIGRPLVQGIGMGVEQEAPTLRGLLEQMTNTFVPLLAGATPTAAAGPVTTNNFNVVVHGVSNPQEARAIGSALGGSLASGFARRSITTAVRTV